MGKLITHIVLAGLVIVGSSALNLHWAITAVMVAAGAVTVHVVWERFFFNPYIYLGTMHVAADDPLMEKAIREASSTMNMFLTSVFPDNRDDSMVKFRYQNREGKDEFLWADLLAVNESTVSVYVRTPPNRPLDDFQRKVDIDKDRLIDWSVEQRDGSLLGGYTNRALFRIFEREEGYMHPEFKQHIARFQDTHIE